MAREVKEWVQINLSFKPEVRERLERLQLETGWSKSQIVAEALRHFEQTEDAEVMGPVMGGFVKDSVTTEDAELLNSRRFQQTEGE